MKRQPNPSNTASRRPAHVIRLRRSWFGGGTVVQPLRKVLTDVSDDPAVRLRHPRPSPLTPYQKAAQVWYERIGPPVPGPTPGSLMALGCLALFGQGLRPLVTSRPSTRSSVRPLRGRSRTRTSVQPKPIAPGLLGNELFAPPINLQIALRHFFGPSFVGQLRRRSTCRPLRGSPPETGIDAYDFSTCYRRCDCVFLKRLCTVRDRSLFRAYGRRTRQGCHVEYLKSQYRAIRTSSYRVAWDSSGATRERFSSPPTPARWTAILTA